ncbi:MAG: 2-C-methyl-D-erythritol 2,4-cyclodiphosphate synthase [Clostridiales bacterium]|nr:2-C-methyl-D-erythritol 2,4-cyclodiphosphate synthase [Clostridiales bacterium]
MRIGIGYDVHRLVENRPLIVGGAKIPFDRGLLGHSDADVLVHAIMDAILGALGMGDIGRHFPDSSDEYKDISSISLLSRVGDMVGESSYRIVNIDSIIMAESPKMAPYLEDMKANISNALGIEPSMVNIKATTTEGLGFVGSGQGIAAKAVALLEVGS